METETSAAASAATGDGGECKPEEEHEVGRRARRGEEGMKALREKRAREAEEGLAESNHLPPRLGEVGRADGNGNAVKVAGAVAPAEPKEEKHPQGRLQLKRRAHIQPTVAEEDERGARMHDRGRPSPG
eukprot:scaffold253305_cov27-Tisochrysis_lutea.AAC.4